MKTGVAQPARKRLLERIGALSLLVLLLAVFWLVLAAPVLDAFAERRDSFADTMRLSEGLARGIARKPALEARKAALLMRSRGPEDVIAGQSPVAAGASLQMQVRQLIEAQGGQLASIALGQPAAAGTPQRLGVSFDARLPGDRLPDFLTALAQARPPLGVTRLDIRSQMVPTTAAATRNTAASLQVSAELYALVAGSPP